MTNRGVNKVILIGYAGRDPEIRYMTNGSAIVNVPIATTESWKDKQTNEFKEKTEWHRVVLFGKLAEIASNYLHKGSQVYIEGSLYTRKWQNQDGQDRYITEIIVGIRGVMQILSNRYTENNVSDSNTPKIIDNTQNNHEKINDKTTEINFEEDDIPF